MELNDGVAMTDHRGVPLRQGRKSPPDRGPNDGIGRTRRRFVARRLWVSSCRAGLVGWPADRQNRLAGGTVELGSDQIIRHAFERFPFALAHETRCNTLFDSVIHRSGDSACTDHALAACQELAKGPVLARSGVVDRQAEAAAQADLAGIDGGRGQAEAAAETNLAGIAGDRRETEATTETDLAGIGGLDSRGIRLRTKQHWKLLSR
jgi:hypothetical protein